MELNEVIKARRSIRKFRSEPVPDSYIKEILDTARLAPSVGNIQSSRYIVIKSAEVKAKLKDSTLPFVISAPIVIVCCTDRNAWLAQDERYTELKRVWLTEREGYSELKNTSLHQDDENVMAYEKYQKSGKIDRMIDSQIAHHYLWQHAAIAIDHMILRAVDLGLGSCWVGLVDRMRVKKILDLDDRYEIVALLPIGYPDQNPSPRPRLPVNELLIKEI